MKPNDIESLEIRKNSLTNNLTVLQEKRKKLEKVIYDEKNKINQNNKELEIEKQVLIKKIISIILITLFTILIASISLINITTSITEFSLFTILMLGIDSLLIYDNSNKYNKRKKELNFEITSSKVKVTTISLKLKKYNPVIDDCIKLISSINKEIKQSKKQKRTLYHQEYLTTNKQLIKSI